MKPKPTAVVTKKVEKELHPTRIFKETPFERPSSGPVLDEDLYKACGYEDVKFIGKVLEIRTIEQNNINQKKDYYIFLGFIHDGLKETCSSDLYAIIKKSLINESYVAACGSLLIMTVRKGYSNILKCLLNYLKEEGNDKLSLYLDCTDEKERSILTNVIMREDERYTDRNTSTDADYKKCLEILMQYNKYFHIDAKDAIGNTALHYAAQNNWTVGLDGKLDHTFIRSLIRNGASINVRNNEGIRVVDRIPPKIIEDFLNRCIKEPKDENREDYALTMDFQFIPNNNESDFIRTLQNSQSHQDLLYHPLITTYLHIRWQQVKCIPYLNIAVNVLFYLLVFFYMIYFKKDLIQYGIVNKEIEKVFQIFEQGMTMHIFLLKIAIMVLGSLLMIREIVEFIIFKLKYLQLFDNYLQVSILVLTHCMLYSNHIGAKQSIMSWLLVFITIEFFLLLEKMHLLKMSLYVSMIRKITFDYVKLFVFMLYPIIAFGISFYCSINIKSEDMNTMIMENNGTAEIATEFTNKGNLNGTKGQNGTKFANTLTEAALKTLIMSTDEFDFSDLDFQHPTSWLLFLLFVFLVFLVGMNLLNGIAITDIQALQKDASKYQIRYQVDCIICYDYLKPVCSWFCCFDKWIKWHNFEYCFPDKVITLYPNRDSGAGRIAQVRCQVHITEKWFNYRPRKQKINSEVSCEGQNTTVGCLHRNQQECDCGHKYLVQQEYVLSARKIMEQIKRKEKKNELEHFLRNRNLSDIEIIAFNVMMQYLD